MPTYNFDPTATATTVDASGELKTADGASSPVIMAEWNGMQWTVNPNQIKHLGDVSASLELETETNDDKEGSAPTKTMNLKDQEFEFDYLVTGYAGVDVRDEYEAWTELVGQYAPFFLAGRRFGPSNVQLTKVALSEGQINDFGEIFAGKIAVVGAGRVGSTFAYTLAASGVAREIVIIDADGERAQGEAMDIAHAVPFFSPVTVVTAISPTPPTLPSW